jgi:3D (Asp-Asp-Asp) domain-containing protein
MLSKWLNRTAWAGAFLAAMLAVGSPQRADAQPIPISLIEVKERTEVRALPAPVKREEGSGLAPGQTKVVSEGQDGQEVFVYRQVFVDGKLMGETLLSSKKTEPKARIVHVGSRSKGSVTSRQAPRSGRTLRQAAEAGRRMDPSELEKLGLRPEYRDPAPAQIAFGAMRGWSLSGGRLMEMKSTAYLPSAGRANPTFKTATGRPARRGMVAVDPRVIPLHSLLYVEGYGWGIAADTGGAIKGAIIDVCVDDMTEARNWGRRKVKVIVFPQRVTSDLRR